MEWLLLILVITAAFFIGSIPTAYWLGKYKKGIDIREHGSGNVGATNAFRVIGKLAGLFVLVIDVAKGSLSVTLLPLAIKQASPITETWLIAILGLSTIAGHVWTPFLKFQGGKGVATSLGVFLWMDPQVTFVALTVWMILLLIFRYVSVSSMAAAMTLPILMAIWARPFPWILMSAILCLIICLRHRSNVQRLLLGTEKKIGQP